MTMIGTEKASEKVIEYIETLILAGKLKVDDRLPAERDLAQTLQVSRSAVREGIRLLETIGIVESRQGSGNYIARHFDRTLEQVLTMMYALDTLSYEQIREFRYAVERQALALAVRSSDEKKKKELRQHLEGMLYGETDEQQAESDRLLHQTLVEMSGNRLVVANYVALNRIIDRFIGQIRKEIRSEGPEEFEAFQAAHRQLVAAVLDGDLEKGKEALDRHFVFITRNFDT